MQVIVYYGKEKIILKKYASYLELDKDLSQFHSLEELKSRLNLDDEDIIRIQDNNENIIHFNSEIIRKTLSFYDSDKGDEFVDWIIDSVRNNDNNRMKLKFFFDDRYLDFTKKNENFSMNDIKNSEGKNIFSSICSIRNAFNMYGDNPGYFELYNNVFKRLLSKYLKKDGKYNYAYMRKFSVSLANDYNYNLIETNINTNSFDINGEKQNKILRYYEVPINNFEYSKKQVTMDDLPLLDEPNPIYDENGIKMDEREFLEEFSQDKKRNLHLRG